MIEIELGERAVAALWDENSGTFFHRINVVRGRAMDAFFDSVLPADELTREAEILGLYDEEDTRG